MPKKCRFLRAQPGSTCGFQKEGDLPGKKRRKDIFFSVTSINFIMNNCFVFAGMLNVGDFKRCCWITVLMVLKRIMTSCCTAQRVACCVCSRPLSTALQPLPAALTLGRLFLFLMAWAGGWREAVRSSAPLYDPVLQGVLSFSGNIFNIAICCFSCARARANFLARTYRSLKVTSPVWQEGKYLVESAAPFTKRRLNRNPAAEGRGGGSWGAAFIWIGFVDFHA